MIVDAPWYVPHTLIRRDLQIPSVKEEISHYSSRYGARLTAHLNDIIKELVQTCPTNKWKWLGLQTSGKQSRGRKECRLKTL
jgi:hypothetical protein